ncbi:MAG TPA: flagellar motor switch protein FliM, partial [Bryobacteraceae bacterium]|nr:flagellar motor switch protein FliM [Bryobacteraceae bacterium]
MKRELSQQEIDAVFQRSAGKPAETPANDSAPTFDFKRPNRIAKSQVRALHVLHESFVRSLVPDLSSYLHTYIVMNLVSVEQISYAEFLDGLPPSTYIVCLGLNPYEGSAVLEINPSLVFPILELLLGGSGTGTASPLREITEIEQSLMEGLVRLILKNLGEAWRPIASIDFTMHS